MRHFARLTRPARIALLLIPAVLAINLGVFVSIAAVPSTLLQGARHVIHISVDGLGSAYYLPLQERGVLPHFRRLQREGAWTYEARTDVDFTVTLPNHSSMLTGRPVNDQFGEAGTGHHWMDNGIPSPTNTLHSNAGYYVASVFDVAHDNGLRTGLFASKTKFVTYQQSYDAASGAQDLTGIDNGRNKVDVYANVNLNSTAVLATFLSELATTPPQYAFVHFADPDAAGHQYGWGSLEYEWAVSAVDAKIGQILNTIDRSATLRDSTWIVLSADHGGLDLGHGISTRALDYRIPMLVWGPGVPANADLYDITAPLSLFPDGARPLYARGDGQPIRNGDGGNCALGILGLPAIPGSSIQTLHSACGQLSASRRDALTTGSVWRYRDSAGAPAADWTSAGFDDSVWPAGPSPLGYGDPISSTLRSDAACVKPISANFRRRVDLPTTIAALSATLSLRIDDGAVIFWDGSELARINMPAGVITHETRALATVSGAAETAYRDIRLPDTALGSGPHQLAIAVHQADPCSSDLALDARLSFGSVLPPTATTPPPVTPPKALSLAVHLPLLQR
jgi:hypothetical protein